MLEINKSFSVGGGEVEKKKKSNLAETDVWKLSIEAGTRFGGRNMQEAVIWDGWGFDAGHSAAAAAACFGTNTHALAKLAQLLFVIGYIQLSS